MSKKTVLPKLRFPEFMDSGAISVENGNVIFESINNRNHNSDLPVLAISQEHGAIPREQIDYNVSVSEKSLKSYKVVEVGDFIISLRSFEGGIEYSTWHGICSPAYIILRKKSEIVEQYYKHYFKTNKFIQDLNKDLEGIRDGKMVSYSQFSAILLPKPVNKEQQKIADCLSSLDDLIAAESGKLEVLKTHKKGLMQKLFPAKGKTVPEVRFKGYAGAWELQKLGDVTTKIGSGKTPKGGSSVYLQAGIPLLRSQNITDDAVDLSGVVYISYETDGEMTNSRVKKGDVLLNITGGSIGRSAVYNSLEPANVNQHVCIVRPIRGINSGFLQLNLASPNGQQQIDNNQAGGGREGLNFQQIARMSFCFPPLQEQAKIAMFFCNFDETITAQSEKIEALKLHKKGLLQELFPSAQEVME